MEGTFNKLNPVYLLKERASFSKEFEVDGMHLLLKTMDTYEEYTKSRRLIETMTRCDLVHTGDYTLAMLKLPSYYPFVVKLISDTNPNKNVKLHKNDNENISGHTNISDSTSESPRRDVVTQGDKEESDIISYFEIYTLPHLGRTFDSRMERVITSEKYRGRGVMTSILPIAIEFSRTVLGCNRIDLIAENPIAIKVYKEFGFSEVDTTVFRLYL